jgi:hypothetical protein
VLWEEGRLSRRAGLGGNHDCLPALLSADLREDALHKQTATLEASAYADKVVRNLGLLLERVKHADTHGRLLAEAKTHSMRS